MVGTTTEGEERCDPLEEGQGMVGSSGKHWQQKAQEKPCGAGRAELRSWRGLGEGWQHFCGDEETQNQTTGPKVGVAWGGRGNAK